MQPRVGQNVSYWHDDNFASLPKLTMRSRGVSNDAIRSAGAGHVLTSRQSQWPRAPTNFSHHGAMKVPIGLETQRRGRRRSVEPISSRQHSCVRHA